MRGEAVLLIDGLIAFLCISLGIVCAFYVSVIGFSVTALLFVIIIGLVLPGGYTGMRLWEQFGAFVCLQIGYFAGVLAVVVAVKFRDVIRIKDRSERYRSDDRNIGTFLSWFL